MNRFYGHVAWQNDPWYEVWCLEQVSGVYTELIVIRPETSNLHGLAPVSTDMILTDRRVTDRDVGRYRGM